MNRCLNLFRFDFIRQAVGLTVVLRCFFPCQLFSAPTAFSKTAPLPIMDETLSKAISQGFLAAHRNANGQLENGKPYFLAAIWVRSAQGFTPMEMGITAFTGQGATIQNLKAIGELVRRFLLDHGHPFAVLNFDFTTRDDLARLDLAVLIDGGEGFKYGGFKFSGSRIQADPLERLSLLVYGESFSESRIKLAQEKLFRTGYFESVVPGTLYRDSTRNLLYPSLLLSDLKGNRLSGILGYDSEKKGPNGVNGYLDIHLINLRGTARDLDFNFESKQTGQNTGMKEARLAYTEPWILRTPIGAKVNMQASLEDSVYDETDAGLELFQDLDFHSRYLVALSWQFNHDYFQRNRSSAQIAGLGFQFDMRDQVPATLNGMRLLLRLNGVHRDLSDRSYFLLQNRSELGLWKNLGRWVGYLQFVGSGNWPLNRQTNRGDLYAVGGANSIRGFREREFLTNLYLFGNIEAQFLLAPHSRASIFVVPALINRLGGDVTWQRQMGYGIGMESGSKDWTFGISYALNPNRSIGNGFIHIRVTNNF